MSNRKQAVARHARAGKHRRFGKASAGFFAAGVAAASVAAVLLIAGAEPARACLPPGNPC